MFGKKVWAFFIGFVFLLSGCAFQSTAKNWHGLMGDDGKPTYYKKTRKVALNLFIAIPFAGNIDVDGMVEELTGKIAEEKGNNVRIVQGTSENYWYGFPPFTWIFTPVITTVTAEYKPDLLTYDKDQEKILDDEAKSSGLNPQKW